MSALYSKKRIMCLVVEDNYFAADIMSIFFNKYDIDCTIAENGEKGLQMYLQNPDTYDVIFCDLQMPVMDGYEMMMQIRGSGMSTALTVPIIAMSGTVTGEAVGKERFSYLLKKPFELQHVLVVLEEVMQACT